MRSVAPVFKDLVLVGGGHSHVAVLRAFGMRPLPGVRITLISRDTQTPYSGMLPGFIAGRYSVDEAHIDLVPLSRFAGARFIKGEVTGLDPASRTILFADRPPVSYDILSINTGSTPSTRGASDPEAALIPVKPIDRFLEQWQRLLERLRERGEPTKIAVVGGGVGGVELALAIESYLASEYPSAKNQASVGLQLLTADSDILMQHPESVRGRLRSLMKERGIAITVDARVTQYANGRIQTSGGAEYTADEVLWVTHAAPSTWVAQAGLEVDDDGFLSVDACLNSVSRREIFGAGDVVTMRDSPRPKSGVFAVRQGKPLAENLRRALLGKPLRRYRPQHEFLRLIGTGDGSAVAVRGSLVAQGRWVWAWKQWIDRRFMRRYQVLPEMDTRKRAWFPPSVPPVLAGDFFAAGKDNMRCGGCGAKVGADVLAAAIAAVKTVRRDDVLVGLDAPDDAAVVAVPENKLAVLSVDAFRPMIEDPYLFGQITANHCLNDLFAMGAEAQSVMTIAAMPVWPEHKLVDELRQMLAGATRVFDAAGAQLVGGHTSEAAELSLGFSVTGLITREQLLCKASLQAGDCLVLTKALGTGTLFAADMRAKARGRWVDVALESMLQSNLAASQCLLKHAASACTDVTGFGLIGHLLEMTAKSGQGVTIDLDQLPALDGALESMQAGFFSTLHPKNKRAATHALPDMGADRHPRYALLFDPQTAGGLLASVPADRAAACVAELRRRGYLASTIIGVVSQPGESESTVGFGKLPLHAE